MLKYIPPDKSEAMRYGVLNLVNGYDHTLDYIESLERPSSDIKSLYNSSLDWMCWNPIRVGESGTLYRFLKFASWKLKEPREFILEGSLVDRDICDNPRIIYSSQKELLNLDNGTSQWASASALMRAEDRVPYPPLKLQLTYDCIKKWNDNHKVQPQPDATIKRHAKFIAAYIKKPSIKFEVIHSEDLCLGLVTGGISYEEGIKKYPQAKTQESNRFEETKRLMGLLENGEVLDLRDHRPSYAVLAYAKSRNIDVGIINEKSIDKSWPGFLEFLYAV